MNYKPLTNELTNQPVFEPDKIFEQNEIPNKRVDSDLYSFTKGFFETYFKIIRDFSDVNIDSSQQNRGT